MNEANANKNMEQRLRRALHKHGYILRKAHPNRRYKDVTVNLGGYMIIDGYINGVVAGHQFDYDLEDVAKFLAELEAEE